MISNRTKMDYSEGFKYDEISVFSEDGIKFCMPVMAFQTELNIKVDTEGLSIDVRKSFKDWSNSRKFPLFCKFDLPDGIYSSYLFKVCEVSEKVFGVDISHYEYKGKNPSLLSMNLPLEDCPFDELVPVPRQNNEAVNELNAALNSEYARLESLLEGEIKEVGMRKMNLGRLEDFKFTFPKYLYN